MKNLFLITEEEKKRILNSHKNATKRQYLNEVGYAGNWIDVNFEDKTLTLNNYLEMENREGGDELKLNKGVVFKVKDDKTLIAKNVPFQIVGDFTGSVSEKSNGDIEYYCSTKEFKIVGRKLTYWGEDFAPDTHKGFNDLCSKIPTKKEEKQSEQGKQTPEENSKDILIIFTRDYPCVMSGDKTEYTSGNGGFYYKIKGVAYFHNGEYQYGSDIGTYKCNGKQIIKNNQPDKNSNTIQNKVSTPSDEDLDKYLAS